MITVKQSLINYNKQFLPLKNSDSCEVQWRYWYTFENRHSNLKTPFTYLSPCCCHCRHCQQWWSLQILLILIYPGDKRSRWLIIFANFDNGAIMFKWWFSYKPCRPLKSAIVVTVLKTMASIADRQWRQWQSLFATKVLRWTIVCVTIGDRCIVDNGDVYGRYLRQWRRLRNFRIARLPIFADKFT